MTDEIRINRTASQPARPDMGALTGDMPKPSPNSKAPWVVLVVVVAAIAVIGILFREKLFGQSSPEKTGGQNMGQSSGYQAVFLTNGQVYFGKMSGTEGAYATMTDIFYLQVGPQQGSQTDAAAPAPQQQISLVKLGQELHGPVDEMHINRDHILFYEDLRSEGQVVQAINNYKANPQ